MNILEEIGNRKIEEIAVNRALQPVEKLKDGKLFHREIHSLKRILAGRTAPGVIAEFKRKSPSRGEINIRVGVEQVTKGYVEAGASALSVLTDSRYFGGGLEDLQVARKLNEVPVLRKDFIIDEYQLYESRAAGADAVLLIAAMLERQKVQELGGRARELGLEVLLEIHGEEELGHICGQTDLVGVNNRDLRDFSVDTDTSKALAGLIPSGYIRVSESGISDEGTIKELFSLGYRGFLIGEYFMDSPVPWEKCRDLVAKIV